MRMCLLEGGADAREQPEGAVVVKSRPPRRAALVAAIGRVLNHPRRPRRVCRLDQVRRERRQR
eukprot:5131066-Pleurochrysis_carterae.AAC.1